MAWTPYYITPATCVVDIDLPWDVTRPADGERELLRQHRALDPGQVRSIEIASQIARAQALQGKIAEADATLTEAEKMLERVEDRESRTPATLRVLLERGRLLTLRRVPSQAR